jgi:hypothetical protein
LVAAPPDVITPAVAPWMKRWDASTGAAIESFGSVTFQQIAAPAGKSEVVRSCEATPGARDDMLDFEDLVGPATEQSHELIRAQHIIRSCSTVDTKRCAVFRDLGEKSLISLEEVGEWFCAAISVLVVNKPYVR